MASFSSKKRVPFPYFVIFMTTILAPNIHGLRKFKSIISFGDSISDTGNRAYLLPQPSTLANFLRLPYGETFFHHPTGRWSDGRLIIDFMAQDFGLPFILPFWGIHNRNNATNSAREFEHGVNFAVAGATALDKEFFDEYGVEIPCPNGSLGHQLSWFKQKFLPLVCANPQECKKYLENALFLVGEIGGNDYNHALLPPNKSIDIVPRFVPHVIKAIASTVEELIKLGAKTLLVPGNFPIGCISGYLTAYRTSNKSYYDPKTGCLNWLNELSEYHNRALQSQLTSIQRHNPNLTIIYADNYGASIRLYRHPTRYGFSKLGSLYACCGGKGPYNMSLSVQCGDGESYTCEDPSLHVCWDGLHYTEAAYRVMSRMLIQHCFGGVGLNSNGDYSDVDE